MCFLIYVPLCLVRKIEKFAITHIFADLLIVTTVIVIIVYAILHVQDNGWGKGNEIINEATWLNMIGFAIYSYEGVGVVLPILELTACTPEKYAKIVISVIFTMFSVYIIFGLLCLFVYGDELVLPLITDNLPKHNAVVWVVKIAFAFNLFFSYPLVIYPANSIIESYLYGAMPKSKKRQWLKNGTRTLMVGFTVVFCLLMGDKLDKFLSLLGSLCCTPICFTLPCTFHLKLCNPSKFERVVDYMIIGISIFIMIFCSGFTLYNWNE